MSDKIVINLEFIPPLEQTIEEVASSSYPGWHDIIKSLLEDLFKLGWTGDLQGIDVRKQGVDALDVHINGSKMSMFYLFAAARHASLVTCRECGAPGHQRRRGDWIEVLCDKHEAIPR